MQRLDDFPRDEINARNVHIPLLSPFAQRTAKDSFHNPAE
jgi:hypothetical protein